MGRRRARNPGRRSIAQATPRCWRQSQNDAPFTYRSVEPNLFDAIVRQQLPPGQGPQNGNGGPQVRPVGGR